MAKRKVPKRNITKIKRPAPDKKQNLGTKANSFVIKVKPLPEALLERLRNAAPVIETSLGMMKNIDHRAKMRLTSSGLPKSLPKLDTEMFGRRVRQMRISRNFPGVQLAIKKTHSSTAQGAIDLVKLKVKRHNENFKPNGYVLLEPIAYAISERLIAMPKIDAPNIPEVLSSPTKRGRSLFSRIKKRFGISKQDLLQCSKHVIWHADIADHNLWLLGFEKGRFVFMAMPDFQ